MESSLTDTFAKDTVTHKVVMIAENKIFLRMVFNIYLSGKHSRIYCFCLDLSCEYMGFLMNFICVKNIIDTDGGGAAVGSMKVVDVRRLC